MRIASIYLEVSEKELDIIIKCIEERLDRLERQRSSEQVGNYGYLLKKLYAAKNRKEG